MPKPANLALCYALASALLVAQSQPDLAAAQSGLAEFTSVCKEAGEQLWGVSLCGRLLLVDAQSRITLATVPDPDGKFENKGGLFLGKLPSAVEIANTSVRWGG